MAGGLGGIALYAKIGKKQIQPLADLAAPGAALFLAVARLAEGLTTQGLGYYVFDKTYQWFPLAVRDIYGYWAAPVFVYEALAALVIAALCAAMLFRAKAGTGTVLFVALLSLSQILLDSWRSDEYIRFGFVHLNQLAAVGALGILLIVSVVRRVRKAGWTLWQGARPVLFAGIVGVLIWLEFALDKSRIDDFILYLIMTAALAVMGIAVLCAGRENRNKQKA